MSVRYHAPRPWPDEFSLVDTIAIDGKNEADGNEKVENQESEGLKEQLVQLKEEHAGIQRTMEDVKLGLERKRVYTLAQFRASGGVAKAFLLLHLLAGVRNVC
ncbi:hypothetical protein R1flu_018082 [Riccia fluitans]|uniref:Uncharacterized protein n=1 Tax=Riccia fluitans TaxID=41844 RepID=A0ABD1ZIR3_9MARC